MERKKELLFSAADGIATPTFDRPAYLNRLSLERMEESQEILKDLEAGKRSASRSSQERVRTISAWASSTPTRGEVYRTRISGGA